MKGKEEVSRMEAKRKVKLEVTWQVVVVATALAACVTIAYVLVEMPPETYKDIMLAIIGIVMGALTGLWAARGEPRGQA